MTTINEIHADIETLHRDCMERLNGMWWQCERARLGLDVDTVKTGDSGTKGKVEKVGRI